ncbi:MAG TPA: type I secretion protein TolC [Gammaproteobacteria bacterium]|nr:type I secretion protein TolC [Gammaproteobacteria bacterium]
MRKMHHLVFAGIVVALGGSPAAAEDLLQVYRQAQDSDPVVKAAAATQQASEETLPQARALLLPSLDGSVQSGKDFGTNDSSAGGSRNYSFDTYNYSVSLNQPIYDRGSQVQQRLAQSTVEKADVDFRNAQSDLILRVAQGYFGVLIALDSLTFATAEKNAFARQLEQANRRFEVGLATITDVYDAQASFDGAVSREISAINALADAREQLRQLTGLEYAKLSILSEKMPLSLPNPQNPEEWVGMALANNLALLSAGFSVDQARENINVQKAGHYPTLGLNVSSAMFNQGELDTTLNRVNLQLAIPLYSGGAVSSKSRQAAYSYESSRQQLENLQRDTIRVVRDAYRGQETAISQIKAMDQTRVSTRSALEANQAGYEVGTRTIVDVLNAERSVFQAERDYASARYNYILNFLILRQASGQLSEADLTEINGWLDEALSTSAPRAMPVMTARSLGEEQPIKSTPAPSKANGKPDQKTKPAAK